MKSPLVLLLCLLPHVVSAQSAAAKSALSALVPKAGDAGFAASVLGAAATLGGIDDELWLLETLAPKAAVVDQRKILVSQRAAMLELSGRYADAATVWESAVAMVPGKPDSAALLSAAACRLASGDSDGAAGLVTALSFSSADAETAALADIIAGWIALSRGDRERAVASARRGAEAANGRVAMAALYLGCAATDDGAGREQFSTALSKRFPALPDDPVVSSLSLLMASLKTVAATTETQAAPTAVAPAVAPAGPPAGPPAGAPAGAATTGGDTAGPARYYQIGAFRDQANAQGLAQKLEKLGLSAAYRLRSKKDLYVVYVESGADAEATILKLKDAGYEAWPLDGLP